MINLTRTKPQHSFLLNSRQTENLQREDMLTEVIVKHVHKSLVAIYTPGVRGETMSFRGSGVLACGNIQTAAHVLYNVTEVASALVGRPPERVLSYPDLFARVQTPLPQRYIPLNVNSDTDFDLLHDVAMIKLNQYKLPQLKELKISSYAVQPGDSCLCCGSDENLEVIVSQGKVGNAVGRFLADRRSTLPYGVVYISARADAGHSGCPIVRPINGSLIGLLSGAANHHHFGFTFISYMIPINVLLRSGNCIHTH